MAAKSSAKKSKSVSKRSGRKRRRTPFDFEAAVREIDKDTDEVLSQIAAIEEAQRRGPSEKTLRTRITI